MRLPPRLRLPIPSSNAIPPATAPLDAKTAPQRSQTLSLRDGRILGFGEYGSPTGFPLLYFHGYPSSRLEAWSIEDIARRRGLRIIAPDRPGYGLSTFQLNRRITDWPSDMRALADHLNLSRFAVMGGSGGGPYALACAYALPRGMMSAVGVMAGAPPWSAGRGHMSLTRRMSALLATCTPNTFEGIMDGLVGTARWCVTTGPVTRWLDAWIAKQSGEGAVHSEPIEVQRMKLLAIMFEAFAQGSAAAVQEARLLTQDWGFRLEDVGYENVMVWHGEKDGNAPVQMIRYMVDRLPHCVYREYEGETHYTLGRHLEDILGELVPESK